MVTLAWRADRKQYHWWKIQTEKNLKAFQYVEWCLRWKYNFSVDKPKTSWRFVVWTIFLSTVGLSWKHNPTFDTTLFPPPYDSNLTYHSVISVLVQSLVTDTFHSTLSSMANFLPATICYRVSETVWWNFKAKEMFGRGRIAKFQWKINCGRHCNTIPDSEFKSWKLGNGRVQNINGSCMALSAYDYNGSFIMMNSYQAYMLHVSSVQNPYDICWELSGFIIAEAYGVSKHALFLKAEESTVFNVLNNDKELATYSFLWVVWYLKYITDHVVVWNACYV